MGHTYTNLLVHVIFSTKDRQPCITPQLQPRLYEYLGGLARGEFGVALQVGGTSDHVHGLLSLRPDVSVSHAMNRWKSLSSGWIKRTFPDVSEFAWQEGYGAFTVSRSQSAKVDQYIRSQAEHHRRRSFQEEFIEFLEKHGIEYDPRTIWE
jgi:putative transposase